MGFVCRPESLRSVRAAIIADQQAAAEQHAFTKVLDELDAQYDQHAADPRVPGSIDEATLFLRLPIHTGDPNLN